MHKIVSFYKEVSLLNEALQRLHNLIFYRSVIIDPVVAHFIELTHAIATPNQNVNGEKYSTFISVLIEKAEELGLEGNIFAQYIFYLFLNNENTFSLACEQNTDMKKKSAYGFALKDTETMLFLSGISFRELPWDTEPDGGIIRYTSIQAADNQHIRLLEQAGNDAERAIEILIHYYSHNGAGILGNSYMLKYDETRGLISTPQPDTVSFSDIIGYTAQKEALIRNTEAFVSGAPAHNVLLTGYRGTGKSSCVKALANKYGEHGLRLVEISKEQSCMLPEITRCLAHRNKRFIIFIDDLSFDDCEIQYKYLKSLLEGGVEARPENIIIYVTSNRRHLIQERWNDRNDSNDSSEIHSSDNTNEKLSLSDRFGLTITFPKPSPSEYFEIVKGLASKDNIDMPEELLQKAALSWEINQKGMSGRTARQFINSVLTEQYLPVQ